MRTVLLGVLMALSSCAGPTDPQYQVPVSGREVDAPQVYAEWWVEVQEDAGIERSLDRVRFFSVPRPWYNQRYGRTVHGLWVPDGRIYIVDYLLRAEGLVKHEMLHELLRGDSAHAHPLFAVYDDPLYTVSGD